MKRIYIYFLALLIAGAVYASIQILEGSEEVKSKFARVGSLLSASKAVSIDIFGDEHHQPIGNSDLSEIICITTNGCSTDFQIVPAPVLPPKSEREENCVSLGRIPRHITNIGLGDLANYPDMDEKIYEFDVIIKDEATIIRENGSLGDMISMLQTYFPVSKLLRKVPLKRSDDIWIVRLNTPLTLREFAGLTTLALLQDSEPFYSNEPGAELKRRIKCRLDVISPERYPSEDFDQKYTGVAFEGSASNVWYQTINQNDLDISLPWDRTNLAAIKRPATNTADIIEGQKIWRNYVSGPPPSRVNVAMIDSGFAFNHQNGPRFRKIETQAYKGEEDFSHAMNVASRMAAPFTVVAPVGVVPTEALEYLDLDVYSYVTGSDVDKIVAPMNISGLGERYDWELISYLSGMKIYEEPKCFDFLKCFTNDVKGIPQRPSFFMQAVSVDVNNIIRTSIDREKFACGGPIRKAALDERPWAVPIVQAAGNHGRRIAGQLISCEKHYIGVIGTSYFREYINSKDVELDNGSSIWEAGIDNGAAYVGVPMQTVAQMKFNGSEYFVASGTSGGVPTVAGILAASLMLESEGSFYQPATAREWTDLFGKASSQVVVDRNGYAKLHNISMPRVPSPFLNAGCFYQAFAKNQGLKPLTKNSVFQLNFDRNHDPANDLCAVGSYIFN